MKKIAAVLLVSSALVLGIVLSGEAWGGHGHGHGHFRSRVFIGVGPAYWWGWGPYPYWYYPYYPYDAYPTPVVVQDPPVYIQQSAPVGPPVPASAAPPAAPTPPPAESYWYYCPSARTYYPMIQTCPEPWVKVPPRP